MWLIKDIDQDQLSIFPRDFFEATSLRNRAVLHYGIFLSGLARIELTWIKAMAFLVSNFRYAGIASRHLRWSPGLIDDVLCSGPVAGKRCMEISPAGLAVTGRGVQSAGPFYSEAVWYP